MDQIFTSPGSRGLLMTSLVARLPLAMLGIGLLVHAQQVTGSFGQAGLVAATFGISLGIGGPLLGNLVDRHGQRAVLLASASTVALLLLALALLADRIDLGVLIALAAGTGLAAPPVGACLRAQLPSLLDGPGAIRRGYAFEASLVELTYIGGPPLVLWIGALSSSGAALAGCGLLLLASTAAFVGHPSARVGQPATQLPAADLRAADLSAGDPRLPGRTVRGLRTPAIRTLLIVLFAVGVLLGAGEVAVFAAAKTLHSAAGGAPLFAVWGAGSFVGGLLIARLGGSARPGAGLMLLLAALTIGHLALIPAQGSVLALGFVLLIAGATIAPTEAALYAMVDGAVPSGALTSAFSWLATAMTIGAALGSAAAGAVVDRAGPTAAFALAGAAGALGLLTAKLRAPTIEAPTPGSPSRVCR